MTCRDCQTPMRAWGQPPDGRRLHCGRGLCANCWRRHRLAGDLEHIERRTHSRDQLLADYRHLTAEGHDIQQIAERLGVTPSAIYKALARSRTAA